MGAVKTIQEAAVIYRDTPNTFGHEENDVPRTELKRLIGLVASQKMLHESLAHHGFMGFEEYSGANKFLYARLKVIEDDLRKVETQYGIGNIGVPYRTMTQ